MIDGPYKLPEGWRWVRLGEACQINPRRPRLDMNPTTEVTFVPMSAVDAELGIIYTPEIKPFSAVKTGYTYFEENDVLFAKITPCMENGKSAVARGLLNNIGFGSTEFHVLRPIDSVLSEWIWLYVRKKDFRESARAAFRGGVGQQRVPAEFLQEACIPLPPLNEQQRIVAQVEMLMEQVREARRLRQKAVEDADLLWQSVLADTFPRPGTYLPSNWRWARLEEVCEVNMGQSPPSKAYNQNEVGLPFFQGKSDFGELYPTPRVWCSAPKKIAIEGDILISVRAPVGPTNLTNIKCCIGRGLAALRVRSELDRYWLLFYLRSIENLLASAGTGSTFNAITKKELVTIPVPLPPLEEQRRIIICLEETQEKIKLIKDSQAQFEAELQCLEQSILASAFKGKL